ncbi:hypothetical protein HPP92_021226 [Vanilla planifolia]|uniref:Uncharacterized protein n=1 Tax=Vanilla planifolia TaxID=51239 RepID=A0A835Q1Y2_VANPL|nr:hypothetical protein HPP92_021226 [Vanilla planifolia]
MDAMTQSLGLVTKFPNDPYHPLNSLPRISIGVKEQVSHRVGGLQNKFEVNKPTSSSDE